MYEVTTQIAYFPTAGPDITTAPPFAYDMRDPASRGESESEIKSTQIHNGRDIQTSLASTGFVLLDEPSGVIDFLDHERVVDKYYAECKSLAQELTGASTVFTYDHLVREPGRQIAGGGTDGSVHVTGEEQGGGYIGFAHMDYTDNTGWKDYLAVHAQEVPSASRVVCLNFWRGISRVVDDHPLAVCDARTIRATDLFETKIFGYGPPSYSWHDVGIETYSVKHSASHKWYYFPKMTPNEVLIFKTYDSEGVIGNACAHAAFTNPVADPAGPQRRSIELRVLCFID
ncbi:MAG: CmcJ/NvfI family oxidoreductase [Pseudomonadota bacterium]